MKTKRWAILLVITLLISVLPLGTAASAEDVITVQDTVMLLQEGELPDAAPAAAHYQRSRVQTFALRAADTVTDWVKNGLDSAMRTANAPK